jgi:heterotetrameric sarcosine oxidase gamma subunit
MSALIRRARIGETVQVYFGGRTVPAQLVAPRFVKPDMTETPGTAIAPLTRSDPTPSLFALRGAPESFGALGLSPPTEPNTVVERDGARLLWLAPDEFLLIADDERGAQLRSATGGVIDVSCAYAIVALGAGWRERLAVGCKLDLRDFGKGRCARTLVARAGVIVEPRGEDEALLYVRPSFETYLRRWLGL